MTTAINVPAFDPPPSREYKVKAGDKLDVVAKKYGFKDHKPIWEARENTKLKQKRKQPHLIQAKDVVTIPPTPQEMAKATVEHAKRLAEHLEIIAQAIARSERAIKLMEQHKKDVLKDWAAVNHNLEAMYKEVDNLATGLDTAATVATLFIGLVSLTRQGRKATKKTIEEVREINQEMLKDTKAIAGSALTDGITEVVEQIDEYQESTALILLKCGDPSFWGWTIASVIQGKGVAEALKSNPKSELRNNLARVDKVKRQTLEMIDRNIARNRKIIELLRAGENEAALEVTRNKRR